MTLEEYKQALANHDWYSAYSDNYTEYNDGVEKRRQLLDAAQTLDPELVIYHQFRKQYSSYPGMPK